MNNLQRITLLSFLAYFVMSGMLSPIGIISASLSEKLGLSVTEATTVFSWLTMGILVGAILALFVFDWLRLRTLMLLVYVSLFVSLLSFNVSTGLQQIGLALGVIGVCCGIGLAGAALIISRSYEQEQRASMLVITDGSFSVAGMVTSALAAWFVASQLHWSAVYQFVAVIAAIIILLLVTSILPATSRSDTVEKASERWPPSAWLCVVALFLYTLGQYSMLWWLPGYASDRLGADIEQAGRLVSLFWTGLFAAQVVVAWWVLKIGVRRLVLLSAVSTFVFSLPVWLVNELAALPLLAALWGFGNLSLLKIVLSYATEMLEVPSPRLVSALLLGATSGTAVSPWLTSLIVEATDNYFILQFSSLCYFTLLVLLFLATKLNSSALRSMD